MRQLRVAVALATAFLVSCVATAHAQQADTTIIPANSVAVSVCHVEHGKVVARTFIDVRELSARQLQEILIHEQTHREDMAQDAAICEGRPAEVLKTEVHAYCVSDSVAVALGSVPWTIYLGTLNTLVQQFKDTDVPYEAVVSAWFHGCGKQLGMTR